MKIALDEARRVAELAALEFADGELERVARDMSRILDYVEQIDAVDVSGVPDEGEAKPTPNRADEVHPAGLASEIEDNAPSMSRGHFVVPRVIGGE